MIVYKNILSQKERLKLLKFVKTVVKDLGPNYPGLQSKNNLHEYKELKQLLNKTKKIIKGYAIKMCWANFSNGDYISWHNHLDCDKSLVYYLKNKSKIGTMFKEEGNNVKITLALQNSALMFDSSLTHSVPCHLFEERDSIAFDLIKIWVLKKINTQL